MPTFDWQIICIPLLSLRYKRAKNDELLNLERTIPFQYHVELTTGDAMMTSLVKTLGESFQT
jgi:hypothetical protein